MTNHTDHTDTAAHAEASARALGQAMAAASEALTEAKYAEAQVTALAHAGHTEGVALDAAGMLKAAEMLRALAGAAKAEAEYAEHYSGDFDAAVTAHRIANGGAYVTLAELGALEAGGLAFGYAIKSATGRPGLSPLGKTLAATVTRVDA